MNIILGYEYNQGWANRKMWLTGHTPEIRTSKFGVPSESYSLTIFTRASCPTNFVVTIEARNFRNFEP